MARYTLPGKMEVYFATTLADYTAPTAAEAGAATELTSFCRGAPDIPETGNTAVADDLSSKFNKRSAASYGGDSMTVEVYRDDGTDTAYTTLTRGTSGYWMIYRQGCATPGSPAAADVVDVYPVEILSRGNGTPGRDENDFIVSIAAITDVPSEATAVVA